MIFEVVSADVDQGLIKGTTGFCPVAITEGMKSDLIKPLMSLAKNQAKSAIENKPTEANELNDFYSSFPIKLSNQRFRLLTRGACVSGTSESRKFIVHQMLIPHQNDWTCGPVAMLAKEDAWITQWSTKPQLLKPRSIEVPTLSPRICRHWESKTRDGGWAGLPLEAFEKQQPCLLSTDSDFSSRDILELFMESQSLLRYQDRWDIPFSIRAWHPFGSNNYFWSVVDRGTQQEIEFMHLPNVVRIDLTNPMSQATCKYANAARAGNWVNLQRGGRTDSHTSLAQDEEIKLAPPTEREPVSPGSSSISSGIRSSGASSFKLSAQSSIKLASPAEPRQTDGPTVESGVASRSSTRLGGTNSVAADSQDPAAKTNSAQPKKKQFRDSDAEIESSGIEEPLAKPAQPSFLQKWLPSTSDGWIRTGIVFGVVAGLSVGIWYAISMIQTTLEIADNIGGNQVAIIGNNTPNDDEPDNSDPDSSDQSNSSTENSDAPVSESTDSTDADDTNGNSNDPTIVDNVDPADSDPNPIEEKPLTRVELKAAIAAMKIPASYNLKRPVDESEPQLLFSIPVRKKGLNEFLLINSNTDNKKYLWTWDPSGDSAKLEFEPGKTMATISLIERSEPADDQSTSSDESVSGEPVNDDESVSETPDEETTSVATDFVFQWVQEKKLDWRDYYRVIAGRLEVGIMGGGHAEIQVPLANPVNTKRFRIADATFDGLQVKPHLQDYLTNTTGFEKFIWSVDNVRVPEKNLAKLDESEDTEQVPIWKGNVDDSRVRLVLNEELVRSEVAKLLKVDLSVPGPMTETIDRQIRYHSPLGIETKASFSIDREFEGQVVLDLRSRFLFDAKGEDLGNIYFDRIPNLRADTPTKKKKSVLPDYLIYRLLEFTGTNGKNAKTATRIIGSNGKGCTKAPTDLQKASLAIAGVYHKYVTKLLENEIEFEVSRSGGPLRSRFEVKVNQFDWEQTNVSEK
ncbi:MAG: hypothetical protein AAFN77_04250 [Planctomycetota bacterium]